ncbi:MAG: 30S ribosomal protein S5 [Planctomycetes bacterium]|nr:30S ribosomal protein S5 [Planctomycetota bacterium]
MKPKFDYLDTTEASQLEGLSEVLIQINRSAAVVKGGRRFSFSALTVAGNRSGTVGQGFGKARQVPNAIEKATKDARKHMLRVPLTPDGSIPHEVNGRYCGSMVRLIPAAPGTGVIAGSSVRAVCEMAGVKNILSKAYGSTNPVNLVKATFHALTQLRTREQVAQLRGVELT